MSNETNERIVERFIAGEDRLAGLLRSVPRFEAPVAMTARFAELARTAQAEYAPLVFAPPASLEAGFLSEAVRIQAAQQPRHDAVIDEIHAGRPAAEVLGHDVTAATAAWLANRPPRPAASPPAPHSAARKWWPRVGVLIASAFFGGVVSNLWLAQRAEHARVATALNEKPAVPATASLPPTVVLQVPQIAQVTRSSKLPDARVAPAAPPRNAPERYAKASKNVASMGAAMAREEAAPAARDQVLEQRVTIASASPSPASEAPSAAPRPMAAPAASIAESRSFRAAPMAKAAGSVNAQLRFGLSTAPQDAAQAWQAITRDYAPRIFVAHPEAEPVQVWVERFRQSLPPELRDNPVKVEQDTRLRDDVLRLEGQ
ncbi:MAG: hypothetical protein JWM03_1762 [Rhodocyclales bacterium]|nr:hypothetical protein [Rhodocyclales bacterium]